MKTKIVLLMIISLMLSCSDDEISDKEKSFDFYYLYRAYFHVSREINKEEKEVYYYDYTPLNRQQRDTLLKILKELNTDYKLCADSTILVSTTSVPDAYYMSTLDNDLKKRIGKKGHVWSK